MSVTIEHETVFLTVLAQNPVQLLIRYRAKIMTGPVDECWPWLGFKVKNYGRFT